MPNLVICSAPHSNYERCMPMDQKRKCIQNVEQSTQRLS
ncbi:hypothetical protein MAR_025639 [Mya arenaria]|uniref:Uncharacterized protein n=1 Tax=Mya arenaria TaxID=6604 RepID=A0ABY7EQP3_MYAAR|nr:hypothetical protein MAR_025639 [Mya arenaria]